MSARHESDTLAQMQRCARLAVLALTTLGLGCDSSSSVAPSTESEAPAQSEAEASASKSSKDDQIEPALIATYQNMVRDVYFSDFERCLEDQMESEETMYMRSAFTLSITVAADGTTNGVHTQDMAIKVRNYEGRDLADGNAEAMSDCITTAAAQWEFEPLPPREMTFKVDGSVGD